MPDQVADLILEAMPGGVGPADTAALSPGAAASGDAASQAVPTCGPGRIYLRSVSVCGFRGIAEEVPLHLQAGPGLTVVTGRNGSGKSSFAEAAEIALTGDNKRWADRTAVWKDGWRNLHCSGLSAIEVKLTEEGRSVPTVVVREWAEGAALDGAQAYVSVAGTRQPLASKGWARPLELYRPFLSYAELGALVSGRPSEMHDAMQAILGLDVLNAAERTLGDSRKSADSESKQAKQQLPALLEKLAVHPDERARAAERALTGRHWDLAALAPLAVGDDAASDGRTALLQQVAAITLPAADEVTAAVSRLMTAQAAVAALAGTRAADARRLAALLSAAVEHQASHAGERCPVCGGRVLDEAWHASATASIEELTAQAAEADAAHKEAAAAGRALRELAPYKPAALGGDLGEITEAAAAASAAWDVWTAACTSADAADGAFDADAAVAVFRGLWEAVAALRERAEGALRRRAEAWQPMAADLAAWLGVARGGEAASVRAAEFKSALDNLRLIAAEVRNERLAPFARTSAEVWETLRQESNVELGPITLDGTGTRRRVALDVTVDGVAGAALSVMLQGELHALGLALFLPRATAEDSPFGFVVIDDPVQAMDPAKVDGLARVLSSVAASRQVIVFTHDDRLPAALRQLQLPATVLAVTRRERSVVSVRKVSDPVARYLDDAWAMAKTAKLTASVRAVAVAGLCRSAIEAACVDVVQRRELSAGASHAAVDRDLEAALHSLQDVVSLALFGDVRRAAEVPGELARLAGPDGRNAFWDAKKGVHDPQHGNLEAFVDNTKRLITRALRS